MSANFKVSYKEDMAVLQNLWTKVWLAIFFLLIIVSPLFLNRYQLSILNEMGIATIGALGLNLLMGYTGQINYLCRIPCQYQRKGEGDYG